jgi:hypothetical protein
MEQAYRCKSCGQIKAGDGVTIDGSGKDLVCEACYLKSKGE